MEATSWVFPAGHSIRLSVAGNDWPNTWVPPQPVTLTIESLQMQLPVIPPGGAGVPNFAAVDAPRRGGARDDATVERAHDVLNSRHARAARRTAVRTTPATVGA